MPLDAQLFNTLKDVIAKMFINVRAESAGRETNVVTATQEITAVNRVTGISEKAYGVGLVLISTNEK